MPIANLTIMQYNPLKTDSSEHLLHQRADELHLQIWCVW